MSMAEIGLKTTGNESLVIGYKLYAGRIFRISHRIDLLTQNL